jgi:rhamnosyltransferase
VRVNDAAGTPRVSLIVRAYNEAQHIGTLLELVAKQDLTDHEVILVDSGSTDETVAIAERHGARVVRIAKDEFTFGRSLNVGCAAARGDFLVMASAHVFPVDAHWLSNLVRAFDDPQVGLAYGRQMGHARSRFSETILFRHQYPARSNPDQKTPFCNNANCAVRRSLWVQHRYDESLTGLEDLAWAQWLLAAGGRIAYVAEAAVEHLHEEPGKRVYHRYEREAIALRRIVPDSHMYFLEFVRLLTKQLWGDLTAMWRERRTLLLTRQILVFRLMQYWGTFRGMNQRTEVTQRLLRQFYYPDDGAPRA